MTPQFQPSAPSVPPAGMAAIKYFANIFCCLCGVGRGMQRPGLGVPRSSRRAPGSSQALGPGGQRDASVWVCLWHSARPESCCSAASLPSSPAHLTALRCGYGGPPWARPGFRYILWPWVGMNGRWPGLPVLNPLAKSLSLSRTEAQLIITLT